MRGNNAAAIRAEEFCRWFCGPAMTVQKTDDLVCESGHCVNYSSSPVFKAPFGETGSKEVKKPSRDFN